MGDEEREVVEGAEKRTAVRSGDHDFGGGFVFGFDS